MECSGKVDKTFYYMILMAVMKWQMLHSTPINAQLQTQVQKLQQPRRHALVKQLYCLRYLLRRDFVLCHY